MSLIENFDNLIKEEVMMMKMEKICEACGKHSWAAQMLSESHSPAIEVQASSQ